MRLFNIIAWAGVLLLTTAVVSRAEIIWHAPVTADEGMIVYEEGPYAIVEPVTPLPVAPAATDQETITEDSCAVADSPFAVAWLAARPRLPGDASRPMIVVVIDDMGIDTRRTEAITRLPAPLTLAYLPYARHVQAQADVGRARGHSIMMHVPMQPDRMDIDPGPNVLRADIPASELAARIAANLDGFTGYTGINNHMGSRFTQNRAALDILMAELRRRHLFFLDSKTHPRSAAGTAALTAGVLTATRDVFLDHVETPEAVAAALLKTEQAARRQGSAIAIGHPKDVTIAGLSRWLPGLAAKGFDVVTLDDLLRRRYQQTVETVSARTGP